MILFIKFMLEFFPFLQKVIFFELNIIFSLVQFGCKMLYLYWNHRWTKGSRKKSFPTISRQLRPPLELYDNRNFFSLTARIPPPPLKGPAISGGTFFAASLIWLLCKMVAYNGCAPIKFTHRVLISSRHLFTSGQVRMGQKWSEMNSISYVCATLNEQPSY